MALFRIGTTFESSILVMDEPLARAELAKVPGGYAWKYHGPARHWELCNVDCRTGELYTVGDLERLNARGLLK